MLSEEFRKESTRVLKDRKVHEELKSRHFDAVITETFESSGFYLAHLIGVNPIAVMSAVRHQVTTLFGQENLGYVPGSGSNLAPGAGFFDRLNDYYTEFFDTRAFFGLFEKQHEIYSEAIGGNVPHWKELVMRSPMYLTNGNPYLDFAVPTTRNIIQVGGITVSKDKKVEILPEEYDQILKERDSTVLVSFGSVVRSFQMPENFKAGLIQMFQSLPEVTFIWKYEKEDEQFEKRLPSNVHLKKWVPQPALLADERLKVFVTHGGLGSTMEVAYCGKPALMIPLFGDQPHNAQMLSRHGGAVAYDKFDLSDGKKLTEVMRKMVTSTKYKDNAVQLREVLYQQPIEPKETFVKNVEFAVRFPNFKSQIPEISKVGVIAYYYLDVVAFFLIFFCVLTFSSVKFSINVLRKLGIVKRVKSIKNE